MKTPMGESGKDFVNMDMRTNKDKVRDAELALRVNAYQQAIEEDEWDAAIVDLLADLMHVHKAKEIELSFNALYETARMHFEEEVIEEDTEEPKSYLVNWEIEIMARTHQEAAEEAQKIQRDLDSMATVFCVVSSQTGERREIDLEEVIDV